jgi:PleD family two-component response regulator
VEIVVEHRADVTNLLAVAEGARAATTAPTTATSATEPVTPPKPPRAVYEEAFNVAQNTITLPSVAAVAGACVLWVDDEPTNNRREIQALEKVGIQVSTTKTTDDALAQLKTGKFDLVITDLDRDKKPTEGFTLIRRMRESSVSTLVIVYVWSVNPSLESEAVKAGAMGITNSPTTLFRMAMNAIHQSRAK